VTRGVLVALLFIGCTPLRSDPPPPVANVGTGEALAPAAESAVAAGDKPAAPDDDRCSPEMFIDHPVGTAGLFVFTDASGLYGYRDAAGQPKITPSFFFAYEFGPGGVAAVMGKDGPAFIATDGTTLARAFSFDNGPDYFVAGRARIVDGDKMGFIDDSGRIVVRPRWDFASSFCMSRAAVCLGCAAVDRGEYVDHAGGKWGFIDREGAIAVPVEYDEVEGFGGDGSAWVVKGGLRTRVDRRGRPLQN
jgi:hypothetical protein